MKWTNTLWKSLRGPEAQPLRQTFASLESHLQWPRLGDEPPHGTSWQNAGLGYTHGAVAPTLDLLQLTPWYVAYPQVITKVAVVASVGPALATMRVGLYGVDANFDPYGSPLLDVSFTTAAGAATYTGTPTTPVRIKPGLCWVARVAQGVAPTLRSWMPLNLVSPKLLWTSTAALAANVNSIQYTLAATAGALPALNGGLTGAGTSCPRVFVLAAPDVT